MPISNIQFELIAAKPSNPELIDFALTLPSQRLGATTIGDYGAEYIYVYLTLTTAGVTVKQGDIYAWDNSFQAFPCLTANLTRGMGIGAIFLGGRIGDPGAGTPAGGLGAPSAFSYTFPAAGTYGVWLQRAGTSLAQVTASAAIGNLAESTATAGQVGAPASPTVGSKLLAGMYVAPTVFTFTGTTVVGSTVISAISSAKGLVVGQTLSGTGIATGAVITVISGTTVTMSLAATAAGTPTVTSTAGNGYVTTTNGSAVLTNVTTVYGMYPNQTITGTGIPASTTILSINGNPGNYSITLSAAATATANNIAVTTNAGYMECYFIWPYVDKTN